VQQYALIVVPTRELALQVEQEFKSMTPGMKLYSSCFIGGTNINRNIMELRRPSHIVIGTPGRLLDLKNRGVLRMDNFNILVLDEYDRMLDMGFSRDMDRILEAMKKRQQTMLFSATFDTSQKSRIRDILVDPVMIKVSEGNVSADHIDQDIVRVKHGQDPFTLLQDMLRLEEFKKVLTR
jgi:ATP-dependent RNA helicase RhlE